jgi:hypothetical protein
LNDDQVLDLLRELPPTLAEPDDRMAMVEARVRRRRRRTAAVVATGATFGVVAAVAVATTLGGGQRGATDAVDPTAEVTWETPASLLPGATRVVDLSEPLTTEGVGTQTVRLGDRPRGATAVTISLTCLSAGSYQWPDGGSLRCDEADVKASADHATASLRRELAPGDTTIVITASNDAAWRIETTYVRTEPTDWATNANGQTYGTVKEGGAEPDLESAYATNGRLGYVVTADLDSDVPKSIPVYESDGETVIGEFHISEGQASYQR